MANRQVMVITGSRKGIGRFLAEHYVQNGYEVVGCSRAPSDLQLPAYHHYCLDVADEPAVKKNVPRDLTEIWPSARSH